MERHFMKCRKCSERWAVETESTHGDALISADLMTCPSCGYTPATVRDLWGNVAYVVGDKTHHIRLGKVGPRDTKRSAASRCACNDACEFAKGPVCECSCGGKNHGLGWLCIIPLIEALSGEAISATPQTEGELTPC